MRVRRNEDGVFPTTLQVRTATDSTFTAQWDGVDQWKDISFSSPSRVVEAWLDPDRAILLDINHLNNRMVIAPEADNQFARKAQLRAASFFQTVLFVLGGLF